MSTKAKSKNIYNLTKIALCVALLCVSSYLVFPLPFTPVVISLHTIVVNLVGLILKPKQAGVSMLVYLLLGFIGLPIQHICAITMMSIHNGGNVGAAFLTVSLPFIVVDVVKCVMASIVGIVLNKAMSRN